MNVRPSSAVLAGLALVAFLAGGAGGCAGEKANGRPWVHAIHWQGVSGVSKRDLQSKLEIQATSWNPLTPRRYLEPFAVDADRARIQAYYRAHGYFDAKVTSAEVRPRKRDSVDIEFTVEEGAPSRIASVQTQGLDVFAPKARAKVERSLGLRPGQVFVHDRYLAARGLLREQLQLRGYAWPEVKGRVEVDRDQHEVEVRFDVNAGRRVRIGRVDVVGNKRVRAIDIERTADLTPGRWFSPSDLEVARGRVYNTGLFSAARLTYAPDPSDPERANVTITVEEGTFRELRLGGGVGIESLRNDVHLLAQYTRRNFLGGMRVLRLRLEPALVVLPAIWDIMRYGPAGVAEAELRQPFLFGLRHLVLGWVVGYDLAVDYAFQYHGPRTKLGLVHGLWRERVRLGLSYNFQFLDFFNTDPAILRDPTQAGIAYGYTDPYRIAWLQPEVSLDLRDRPLSPHAGMYLLFSAELGGAYTGSAFQYEKVIPDLRLYAPLGKHLTFAVRAQYGQIWTQGDLGSPVTRRLYLGGPNSHRGFNYNRLSYQIPSAYAGSQMLLPIGGDQMVLFQGELRADVVRLFGNWLGLVAFVDAGDVTMPNCGDECPVILKNALRQLDLSQLHVAVGGGLRYATVIGTIRFDLGVRLNRLYGPTAADPGAIPTPDPGDRIAYHISVGEAF